MWLLLLYALLPAIGATLWFWGGVGDGADGGLPPLHKSWRRHVWPVIVGLVLWLSSYTYLTIALVVTSMIAANTLGYGESKPWWYRVLVALALGAPFLFLSLLAPWTPLITLVVFIPLYMLSLRHNWMTWGVVEATVGATQGSILAITLAVGLTTRLLLGV